jgi:hypothetical protein
MFSNPVHALQVLAHGLIGICFAGFVLVPPLLARRVDLNAPDPEPPEA